MEDLTGSLNEPQAEAVTCPGGPLLVVAGPGSGKTRVITHRIAWLVAQGVPPWRILAITFTNKAADEMRGRAAALVPGAGELWVSTFHASCARILRREIEVLGYDRAFTIYDTDDRDRLVKKLLAEADLPLREVTPAAVGRRISWLKNHDQRPERFSGGEGKLDAAVELVWGAYEERMRKANALDFDDLLLKGLGLFEGHAEVRDRWSGRFLHVLVDEYQDTNRIQYLIARHLARVHGNLTVVGDPDQSIYAFRGSDMRNILEFERDFPAARVVRLEQNYRSTATILRAADRLISRNLARVPKRLWTANEEGAPVGLTPAGSADEEAALVAEQVREWLAQGISAGRIAVFYRVNARSRALERALQTEGLRCRLVGAVAFYQRREIKDLLAWLRLAVNPGDEVSFARAAQAPARGLGDRGLETLLAAARREGCSPVAAAARPGLVPRLSSRAREGLGRLVSTVADLAAARDGAAAAAVRLALERTGYEAWLRETCDREEAEERVQNLEELVNAAAECDQREPGGGLASFLERVALVSDQDGLDPGGQAVQLMTLHTAKGLEFDAVALVGLEEGTLPHNLALDGGEGVEEERRLLYVGITRARRRLHLFWARNLMQAGEWREAAPSRFLAELPAECLGGEGRLPVRQSAVAARPAATPEEDLPEASPAEGEIGPGTRIRHEQFGVGTVRQVRGMDRNRRLVVDFEGQGTKILLLGYSRLEIL